ncbi:MAG: ABC transporter permease [Spiroplasma sp.]|nr:ABC transporter permease [Spiroplasma sp.]
MRKSKKGQQEILLLNQEQEKPKRKKKAKLAFLNHALLLKQTLISAWKTKLQLVILLLLTTFSTSLVTGLWISYQRIHQGEIFLELDKANFDAVLPYSPPKGGATQIANQAFSLRLGRLYYPENSNSDSSTAVYFDNSFLGREINLSSNDLIVKYQRTGNTITKLSHFEWRNPSEPLTFNLSNRFVQSSVYGQLLLKARQTTNPLLANNYRTAARQLYQSLFVNFSANQILNALNTYFKDWIEANNDDPMLNETDDDFTNWLINNKVIYRGSGPNDLTISDDVNIAEDIKQSNGILATKLVKVDDVNPRLTSSRSDNFGMNGQWMTINRTFDLTPVPTKDVLSNFSKNYLSPSEYNNVTDGSEPNIYSYSFAQAAAALQNRTINVINQFVGAAGYDNETGQSVSVKVVDLGVARNHNNVNLKIFEGIAPTSKNEIAISPQYARKKRIKPGDTINISNKDFLVSGIGGDAYNIYPTINQLDPVPNTRTEFIAYVYPDVFHSWDWFNSNDKTDISVIYFLPWANVPVTSFDHDYFNDYFQKTLFNNNKISDRNQYDYNNYLIEKYFNDNPDYQSKYQLDTNLVITKDDSQFSVYNKGRTILASTLAGFKYAGIGGVVFLVTIVIFITYLIIKKAIQKDQVSLGILKSAGYSTAKILRGYLAYPILVVLLAIPIGWIIGLAIQVYFTELFNTIFILPYNVLSFNIIPLFIALALIGGFVLLTTLVAGFRLLQKEPLSLIKNDSDIALGQIHHKTANSKSKLGFKGRFLLSLSKTNWKKITMTAVVISIATLAITATISIPATITGMKDNYFKTQKYKNYYQYQTPIPNMPLSKYGLYAWNNLDNSQNQNYYPVASIMPWPDTIIINDDNGQKLAWYNPLDYQKTNNSNNFESILTFSPAGEAQRQAIIEQVGNRLVSPSLPNGPLDMTFLTWSYSWLGGRGFSNALLKDLARLDNTLDKNFSTGLITFASKLLPSLLNVADPGVDPGPDAITEILKLTLPGFIRQILDRQGPNAYDYFSIGHNTVAYNPLYDSLVGGAQEELVTQLQLASTDSGLDKDFLEVQGIDPNTKMLVIKPELTQNLRYDSSSAVIPMVINQSFAAKYKLSIGGTINGAPNVKTLLYRTKEGDYQPIPKSSWYYGSNPTTGQEDKKKIWNNHVSRWNYRGQQAIENTSFYDSFGYTYEGFYDRDGNQIVNDEPEAWTDVNQIWLKLPEDIDAKSKKGSLRTADASGNLTFDTANIASKSDSNWIKPFSYQVADDYKDAIINPTGLLTAKNPEWYGAMLDQGILLSDQSFHLGSLKKEFTNNFPTWWENIVGTYSPITKYKIIGIQDSYDTPRAYIDQKWANLVAGYSYYNDRGPLKDPVYNNGINQWFSGKLSAANDIYDIIGRMSFKRSADDYTMYAMSSLNGNVEEPLIANNDLLTRKQEMLNKMADIAFLASTLFIVTTILCSILIVVMITDAFLEQFRKFMSQMKAEGYTNQEINSFTLGIFTPWVFLGYAAGYGLGYLIVFGFIKLVTSLTGLALPFTFIWWIIPVSFAIIALIYFSTFIINTIQLNKMNLISLLQTN